ncbi:hypothetical protein DMENIID0001_101680 [Sergentomyia squamirostris]
MFSGRTLLLVFVTVVHLVDLVIGGPYQTVDKRINDLQNNAEKYYLKYESLDPLEMYSDSDNKDHVRRKRKQPHHRIYQWSETDAHTVRSFDTSEEFLGKNCHCKRQDESTRDYRDGPKKCMCCINKNEILLLQEILNVISNIVMKTVDHRKNKHILPSPAMHFYQHDGNQEYPKKEDITFSKEFMHRDSKDLIMMDEEENLKNVHDISPKLFIPILKPEPTKLEPGQEYEESFSVLYHKDPTKNSPNPKIFFTPAGSHSESDMERLSYDAIVNGPVFKQHHRDPNSPQNQKTDMFNLKPYFYKKGE